MSYTPPAGDAADATWFGEGAYTAPAGDAADATWFAGSGGDGDPTDVVVTVLFDDEPVFAGVALYNNHLPRVAASTAGFKHQAAAPASATARSPWLRTQERESVSRTPWQAAAPISAAPSVGWRPTEQRERITRTAWQAADLVDQALRLTWEATARRERFNTTGWQQADQKDLQLTTRHQVAQGADVGLVLRHQVARPSAAVVHHRHRAGFLISTTRLARWQSARPPMPGLTIWVPPGTGEPPPREIVMDMVFACPPYEQGAPINLVFGRVCGFPGPVDPDAPLYILPARYYMAVHSLTAHILPGLTQIPIFDVSLSADVGSFGWTFSASGPVDLFDALAPSSGLPAQIRITLDGIAFAFLVDGLQHEERFGRRGVRISGRSVTALLAAPYARESARMSTEALTAQQLAVAALEFTGADLDWGLTDWLVSAGAWSHMGTPLAAVQAIVGAAGGYVLSARNAATLLARHPYPELPGGIPGGPWNWDGAFAADVELAPDALFVTSIERRDGPDFNAVYVSGTTQGVNAWVKRELSAGEKLAQPIADPLITANEAAGQRGLSIVGAAGPKHIVQIEMPILTGLGQPGVLDVGQLVQINHASPWRGRVRSVSVNARMPKARQTVSLERHLETV